MLPSWINTQDDNGNYITLAFLGVLATFVAFGITVILFEQYAELLTPILIAIPMMSSFRRRLISVDTEDKYFHKETKAYFALFAGEVVAFMAIRNIFPEAFNLQNTVAQVSGSAFTDTTIINVMLNNTKVFFVILVLAYISGSVGTVVLSWNASIVGIMFGDMASKEFTKLTGYIPHTSLEMLAFIIAAVTGTLASSRAGKDLERRDMKEVFRFAALGLSLMALAAFIESI